MTSLFAKAWSALRGVGCSVVIVFAANAVGYGMGCHPDGPPDKTDEVLSHCAGEARAALYVGGATEDEAMAVYDHCLKEHGL